MHLLKTITNGSAFKKTGLILEANSGSGVYCMKKRYFFIFVVMVMIAMPAICETNEELAKQVRDTETAFAQTMAARDFAGFVSFLSDEAIFFGGKTAQRGKEAVAVAWKPFFEGADAPFSWKPEKVEVLDSGMLALSSGPVYLPDGKQSGTFSSIWRREADGKWKIIFDKGCPACDCPQKP
jgi:ketosteroid isomerase-like protein